MRLTHSLLAVYDRLVQAILGLAIALLVVGVGLWTEAAAPKLPGADPFANVYSIVSHFGYSTPSKNHIPLASLDALAAADPSRQWLGALSRQRFVIRSDENVETRFDLVIGPMFRVLRVPLIGRDFSSPAVQLPLSPEPIREAIVSHASALRWFGSAQAALGKNLSVATLEWNLNGKNPAEFQIVGVAPPDFVGTNVEQRADFWVGINGWHDVVFPKHQMSEFRKYFAPASLMVQTENPTALAAGIQGELRALGEPQAMIHLVPGTGYHPVRRARFRAIAHGLVLGLTTLALMFVLSVAAHTFLDVERGQQGDWLRSMLGESPLRRGLRHGAAGLRSFAIVMIATGIVLLGAPMAFEASGLPIDAALHRGLREPSVIAGAIFTFAVFLFKRSLLSAALSGWRGERHLGTLIAGFVGLASVCLLSSWLVGGMAIARLTATLDIGMPESAIDATVVPLVNDGYMWMGSVAQTRAIEVDAARQDWALATVGPDGGTVVSHRAQLRHSRGNVVDTVISLNRVSANFFSVLGIRVDFRCGAFRDWPADGVLVNRRFLTAHGLNRGDSFTLVPENGELLRVCGIVDDAQVLDARAGLAAMVYRPLRERRDLAVAVSRESTPVQRAALERILREHFPDTRAGVPQTVRARLDQQLGQERQMVKVNVVMMSISGGIGAAAALMLGAAALRRQSRALGTRLALGGSKWHLIGITLLGPSRMIWCAIGCLGLAGITISIRILGAESSEWFPALALAMAGTTIWAAAVASMLLHQVNEQDLMSAIKA